MYRVYYRLYWKYGLRNANYIYPECSGLAEVYCPYKEVNPPRSHPTVILPAGSISSQQPGRRQQ